MAVTVKGEEVVGPQLRVVPTEEPPPAPQPIAPPGRDAQALAVMVALGHIIGPRLLLLLAGLGAFVLCVVAVAHPSWQGLVTALSYIAFVLGPVFYLTVLTTIRTQN